MPRSPSPPYRSRGYDHQRRGGDSYRYRDDRRDTQYSRDRDRDRDQWSSYGRGSRYRDDRDRRRSYSRSRSRSRSRDRDRDRDRDRNRRAGGDDRRYVPDDRRYSPAKSSRSLTPEEGQITSPLSRRSPAGRRSPPPPPPPPRRRLDTPPRPSRERDRERDRDRSPDRDSDWARDRDRRRPYPARDGYGRDSLSPRRQSRDLSPASSRSRSSRYPSPDKRRPALSPPRQRSPVKVDTSGPDRRLPPSEPTAGRSTRPVPVAIPFGSTRGGFRQPPSGPRSERMPPTGPAIPSGPRALQSQPPATHTPPHPTPSAPNQPSGNPYASRQGSHDAGPSAVHRLSWAERKGSGGQGQGSSALPEEDVKPRVEEDVVARQQISEAEMVERRAREDEARISAELPELKVSFATAPWEVELEQHFRHMKTLEQNTIRAQSAQRIATAMWSDAEADRVAASERRRIAEEQLSKASSLGVGVGLL